MSKKKHVRKHIHAIRWIDEPFVDYADLYFKSVIRRDFYKDGGECIYESD